MGQLCSVYRLTVDRLDAALESGHDGQRLDLLVADRQAVRVDRGTDDRPPDWAPSLEEMTGHRFEYLTRSASSVLLVDIGNARYALAFGAGGRHMLRSEAIERDFGVAIAIRSLDPEQIGDVARAALDTTSRTDTTVVPAGTHVRFFGIEQYSEIVKRIGGRSSRLEISQLKRSGGVKLDGSDAVRVRVATTPDEVVGDLVAIDAAYRVEPHPELAFIEGLRPVTPKHGVRLHRAQRALAAELAEPGSDRIGLALPSDVDAIEINQFTVEVDGQQLTAPEPDLETVIEALCRVPEPRRIEALQSGRVVLSVAGSAEPVETRLGPWLAADLAVGDDRYVFHGGSFYRMTDRYHQTLTTNVADLLGQASSPAVPPWPHGEREDTYCRRVAVDVDGFVTLDKQLVRGGAHPAGVEICDLLGPGGELICVKRAQRSSALSHLFLQAIVAAENLCDGDRAYRKLLEMLPKARRGDVPRRPRFVFAIQLTKGELTAESLFSFSKVGLSYAARRLNRLGMNVSVVSIHPA